MIHDPGILKGTIRGKTIELEQESGLPDGQSVSVTLRPTLPPGEGLQRSFGGWSADSDDLDQFLKGIRHDRRVGRDGTGGL